jgi:broad specificity polyphosphatase/5'/3'-nucleotidase SurE
MTDEVQQDLAEAPAPEQVLTATPETEVTTPETSDAVSKTFSQEELDAAIGKRLAREQRKWERDQAQRLAEQQVLRTPVNVPPVDQFESPEAYADALAYKKAEELIAKRDVARQKATVLESYHEREEEARSKYDDFEQVAYNPNIRITDVMAETIQSSDVGPDVAYYLGANAKEADRISRLSPYMQAKEIGRIEANLVNTPTIKKTTSAPAPISPVTARASGNPSYDTTDPRSTKTMSTSDWIEAERQRQTRKYEAQRR